MLDLRAINEWIARKTFGDVARRTFYRKLAALLSNNVPLRIAMEKIFLVESGMSHMPDLLGTLPGSASPRCWMYANWIRAIRNGGTLERVMYSWIPDDELTLIGAGEKSGRIDATLKQIAANIQDKKLIVKAVQGAIRYPVVLLGGALALSLFFSFKIIPLFRDMAPESAFHGSARAVLGLSDALLHYGLGLALLAVTLTALVIYSLPNYTGRYRVILDRLPPWSIYKLVNGSSFLAAMSAMISSGVRMEDALQQIIRNSSPYMKTRAGAILRHVRRGQNLGRAMRLAGHNFPDPDIINDLNIYAELSDPDEALATAAKEWKSQGVESIQAKAAVAFNISLLVMSLVIGLFTSGTYSLQSQGVSYIKSGQAKP